MGTHIQAPVQTLRLAKSIQKMSEQIFRHRKKHASCYYKTANKCTLLLHHILKNLYSTTSTLVTVIQYIAFMLLQHRLNLRKNNPKLGWRKGVMQGCLQAIMAGCPSCRH